MFSIVFSYYTIGSVTCISTFVISHASELSVHTVCVYVYTVKSDDSSETDSADEHRGVVKSPVRRAVKKRDRKPSSSSTATAQNKAFILVCLLHCSMCEITVTQHKTRHSS